MEKKATRRRRSTGTSAWPSGASRPRSAGRSAAGLQRHFALGQILAGAAAVVAAAHGAGGHDDRSPSARVNSCGTTVSRPAGITAPVMMRTHWPGATLPVELRACEAGAGHRQHGVAAGGEFATAQGVAVHRRVVVRGHGDGRDHVAGQHAAERAADGQLLHGLHARHQPGDELPRLRHGQGIGS